MRPRGRRSILFVVQRATCFYCDQRFAAPGDGTLDHLVPRQRYGSHEPRNTVLACRQCNGRKGNRLPTPDELSRKAEQHARYQRIMLSKASGVSFAELIGVP